jgi:alanyl-tRNA synthetase
VEYNNKKSIKKHFTITKFGKSFKKQITSNPLTKYLYKINIVITMITKNNSYIIADHIRTACFCIADGVLPGGKQRAYILRRLIRRSLAASLQMGIDIGQLGYFEELVDTVIDIYKGVYDELTDSREIIIKTLFGEAQKYQKAIITGHKEWTKELKNGSEFNVTKTAAIAWNLYQSAGVPFEVSQDVCEKNDLDFDFHLVEKLQTEHQNLSRTTSVGQFKSGLGENTGKTTRLHTTTHILHQVLRDIYGESVQQKGSAITDEKARFDFTLDHKIEEADLSNIESKVQSIIDLNLFMKNIETTEKEARVMGAIGLFGEKYGDRVSVYSLVDNNDTPFSREFCGGPHINNTSEIGKFKILKEKSVSAGVRRLEFDVQ